MGDYGRRIVQLFQTYCTGAKSYESELQEFVDIYFNENNAKSIASSAFRCYHCICVLAMENTMLYGATRDLFETWVFNFLKTAALSIPLSCTTEKNPWLVKGRQRLRKGEMRARPKNQMTIEDCLNNPRESLNADDLFNSDDMFNTLAIELGIDTDEAMDDMLGF